MISVCVLLLIVGSVSAGASSSSYACGACMLLVSEIEKDISKVDPKRMIEVGSFRVNPNGDQQGLQQIAFARSEAHISELIDSSCGRSKDYQLVVNPNTGKSVFVNKESTYLKADTKPTVLSKLHHACNDFVDSYEDEMVAFHKKEHVEPIREFCHKRLGTCTSVDVSPLPPNEPEEEKKEVEKEGDEDLNDEL